MKDTDHERGSGLSNVSTFHKSAASSRGSEWRTATLCMLRGIGRTCKSQDSPRMMHPCNRAAGVVLSCRRWAGHGVSSLTGGRTWLQICAPALVCCAPPGAGRPSSTYKNAYTWSNAARTPQRRRRSLQLLHPVTHAIRISFVA